MRVRRPAELAGWKFTLDDNPSLSEDYKKQIKSEFTGLWFKRFILGGISVTHAAPSGWR